ncbi:MAG TPA: tetratricopeptide repeat protein, partial [Chitinophagaceae bacterium]|nr:tetratricopeptide repeat protein [Chitinophagaceae bacterium]
AWIYYNMGKYDKALPYMQKALQTGTKNPTTLCRAGLIFSKAGDKAVAKNSIQQALKNNPNIEEKLRMDSMQVLQSL